MGDACPVRVVERVADLDRNRDRFFDRKPRRSPQPVRERLTFEILENQVVELSVAADVVSEASPQNRRVSSPSPLC